jgi:two-component system, response regulator PdtaR
MRTQLLPPGDNPRHHDGSRPGGHDNNQTDISKLTVVVVEDDFLSLLEAESVAEDAGLDVLATASNAEEALEVIAKCRPDIVLMDINLGKGRDGIDVAIEVNQRFGTRILSTTAYSDKVLKARAHASKPLGWVNKPFSSQMLLEAIIDARDRLKPGN